jgi:hypothetical protein
MSNVREQQGESSGHLLVREHVKEAAKAEPAPKSAATATDRSMIDIFTESGFV